jgi:hypothetical protein
VMTCWRVRSEMSDYFSARAEKLEARSGLGRGLGRGNGVADGKRYAGQVGYGCGQVG